MCACVFKYTLYMYEVQKVVLAVFFIHPFLIFVIVALIDPEAQRFG